MNKLENCEHGYSIEGCNECIYNNIVDDDEALRLDHIPDVKECRSLRTKFETKKFWPTVLHINERGNVDILIIGHNGAKIYKSFV